MLLIFFISLIASVYYLCHLNNIARRLLNIYAQAVSADFETKYIAETNYQTTGTSVLAECDNCPLAVNCVILFADVVTWPTSALGTCRLWRHYVVSIFAGALFCVISVCNISTRWKTSAYCLWLVCTHFAGTTSILASFSYRMRFFLSKIHNKINMNEHFCETWLYGMSGGTKKCYSHGGSHSCY